jgi:hypothetical protein
MTTKQTKQGTTSPAVTVVAGDPAEHVRAGLDWDFIASLVSPAHVAWRRASYALLRADHGRGAVPEGTIIGGGVGAPWATVCEHRTIRPTSTGNAAERAGKDRRTWCQSCADGAPATVPTLGAPAGPALGVRVTSKAQRPVRPPSAPGAAPAVPLADVRAQAAKSD